VQNIFTELAPCGRAREKVLEELQSKQMLDKLTESWGRFVRDRDVTSFVEGIILALDRAKGQDCDELFEDDGTLTEDMVENLSNVFSLIVDVEKRCAVQLAWVRRCPKMRTPCCQHPYCFKCKISNFHKGQTCEERQAEEYSIEAQFCPECGVPTIRSEGCSHIVCVCGANWQWSGDEDY